MSTTPKNTGIEQKRTKASAARTVVAGLALATLIVATGAAAPAHDDPSSPPPTGDCSDFACEK